MKWYKWKDCPPIFETKILYWDDAIKQTGIAFLKKDGSWDVAILRTSKATDIIPNVTHWMRLPGEPRNLKKLR